MAMLVAGFSSFPGAPHNPTQDMVESLGSVDSPASHYHAVTLPVTWEGAWPHLRDAIAAANATTVLMFGLHQRAERVRIELLARNRRELGRSDAIGAFPSGPAVLDGPQNLPMALDWTKVAAALRSADLDFEWSTDAGGYLCNDTLYRLAFHAREIGVARFGFFHVPLSDERVADVVTDGPTPEVFCSIPAQRLLAGAQALIAAHNDA